MYILDGKRTAVNVSIQHLRNPERLVCPVIYAEVVGATSSGGFQVAEHFFS